MKKIVVIGGSGHAKVVIDAIKKSKEFDIAGVIDPALEKGSTIMGIKVLGPDDALIPLFKKGVRHAFIGVGSIGNCAARKRIDKNLKKAGFKLPAVIHPKAVVAEGVDLAEGTFVAAGAVINSGARIGRNAIINTSAAVDHDCVIGDFVHIAPGATLSGGVKIGDETHVGTGANIIQCINIGRRRMIPAGATIRRNYEKE